jgi:L-seryl-tRNA(Ser) seleniumtransferase
VSETSDPRRNLPSVDVLLSEPRIAAFKAHISQDFIVSIIREVISELRAAILRNEDVPQFSKIVATVVQQLESLIHPEFRRVVNGTGVILHTGLGRAPLNSDAIKAIQDVAGYCNLEFDLSTGDRGDRQEHVEKLLCLLTGAEAALVVNNNAAAVYLTLNTLAFRGEAIVSRGQLIEIGGSFRLPDIMRRAGVKLVEVGTTNRTRMADYREAITAKTSLILRAYPSNYRIDGFTETVPLHELVELGRTNHLPVVDDLGGGLLWDWTKHGLPAEPTVQESLAAGVDLVLVSGDKVISGPQAGIILGKRELVAKLKKSALARVLRIDKLSLAALSATLRSFLNREQVIHSIPSWKMLSLSNEDLQARAERLLAKLSGITSWRILEIRDSNAETGSGTLPAVAIPSLAICSVPSSMSANTWAKKLRNASIPVIGTVRQDMLWIDMRTLSDEDEELLLKSVTEVLDAR